MNGTQSCVAEIIWTGTRVRWLVSTKKIHLTPGSSFDSRVTSSKFDSISVFNQSIGLFQPKWPNTTEESSTETLPTVPVDCTLSIALISDGPFAVMFVSNYFKSRTLPLTLNLYVTLTLSISLTFGFHMVTIKSHLGNNLRSNFRFH